MFLWVPAMTQHETEMENKVYDKTETRPTLTYVRRTTKNWHIANGAI